MRVKLKDIKQGKTFWAASIIFDHKGLLHASIERIFIEGRPYLNKYTKHPFVNYVTRSIYTGMFHNSRSLLDDNVLPNTYNLHGLFTSRKTAQLYIDRIARGCLTARETLIRAQMIERAQDDDNNCFDDIYHGEDDWCADDETYALPA